tara:strand:+ start:672 stop:884 length:213 start_codon:yes stop_codon:yes gene_type:complete
VELKKGKLVPPKGGIFFIQNAPGSARTLRDVPLRRRVGVGFTLLFTIDKYVITIVRTKFAIRNFLTTLDT